MAPKQKHTYYAYDEGHDPGLLRLGSLAFEFTNPRLKGPYFHREVPDLLGPPPQATADKRPNCYLSHQGGWNVGFGVSLEPLVELGTSLQDSSYRVVMGKNGSKVELIYPDEFLKKMQDEPAASTWLKTRLSVARKFKAIWSNLVFAPKIWMLTGLYYIEDAKVYQLRAKSKSGNISIPIPIPDPTGIAALLGLAVAPNASAGKGSEIAAGTDFSGKMVWAAQWQRVHAKYSTNSKPTVGESFQLRLLNIYSTETERDDEIEDIFAQVSLGDDQDEDPEEASSTEGGEDYDEETWKLFEEEVTDLLEELEV